MATATTYLSTAEYLAAERVAEEKHEYVEGELRPMAGASRLHNLIVLRLAAILDALFAGKPYEPYVNDMRVRIPDGPYYYPDAVVAPSPPTMEDAEQDTLLNPFLVIAVLSESTATIDRGEKLENYRRIPSLTDYLLVAQDRMHLDHYSRLSATEWRLVSYDKPDAQILLPNLDCTLTLGDTPAGSRNVTARPNVPLQSQIHDPNNYAPHDPRPHRPPPHHPRPRPRRRRPAA